MRQIPFAEFSNRLLTLKNSLRIFKSLKKVTCPKCGEVFEGKPNVTETFEAYQAVLAEKERALFIGVNSMPWGPERQKFMKTKLRDFKVPRCPKCDRPMKFFPNLWMLDKNQNPKGWKTMWQCPGSMKEDDPCFYEQFSMKTVQEWMTELKEDRNGIRGLRSSAASGNTISGSRGLPRGCKG